jgi:hypothetical protein
MWSVMKRLWQVTALLVLIICSVTTGSPVRAQNGNSAHTYTVHVRQCPPAYSGNDLYGTCHGTGVPDVALSWSPDGPAVSGQGTTDENGNIAFTNDTAILGLTMEVVPFDLLTTYAYCTDTVTGEAFESHSGIGGNGLPVMAVGPYSYRSPDVTCDWYLIPSASDAVPTATSVPTNPDPTATTGGVSQLPNTGTGGPANEPFSLWPFALSALALMTFAVSIRRGRTNRR